MAADESWSSLLSHVDDSPLREPPILVPPQNVGDAPVPVPVGAPDHPVAGWLGRLVADRRLLVPAAIAACVALVALLVNSGPQRPDAVRNGAPPAPRPERPHIEVAIMTTTDLGPFLYALDEEYFTKAGFRFDPVRDVRVVDSGTAAVELLKSGEVDIAYATYVPFFIAQRERGNIKLVAGASSAGPKSCMVVAMPGGKVRGIRDMRGKRVAVTSRNTMSELLIMSALTSNGVDPSSIKWVSARFEDMAGLLKAGKIDAAFMTEPFMTEAKKSVGAVPVFDTAAGPTLNLPTAAFGTTAEFARDNPGTVTAFRQVLETATDEVNEDKTKVGGPLLVYMELETRPEMLPQLLTFDPALDEDRLENVVKLMREFKMLDKDIDVPSMIAR
jgi:NitT/TauT family transport system substrate-binding protein